jgi:hypothetical protein
MFFFCVGNANFCVFFLLFFVSPPLTEMIAIDCSSDVEANDCMNDSDDSDSLCVSCLGPGILRVCPYTRCRGAVCSDCEAKVHAFYTKHAESVVLCVFCREPFEIGRLVTAETATSRENGGGWRLEGDGDWVEVRVGSAHRPNELSKPILCSMATGLLAFSLLMAACVKAETVFARVLLVGIISGILFVATMVIVACFLNSQVGLLYNRTGR